MTDKKSDPPSATERTATEEMGDRYRNGAHISPATGDPAKSEPSGLPPGVHDSHKSPVAPK
jgi:hypothetical protein